MERELSACATSSFVSDAKPTAASVDFRAVIAVLSVLLPVGADNILGNLLTTLWPASTRSLPDTTAIAVSLGILREGRGWLMSPAMQPVSAAEKRPSKELVNSD